jgi:hypothetical protein
MLGKVHRRAFEILRLGAAQPRSTFDHLIERKDTDFYHSTHFVRVGRMLIELGELLDVVESRWKLVRISRRGQEGLYRLVKREHAENHGQESLNGTQ